MALPPPSSSSKELSNQAIVVPPAPPASLPAQAPSPQQIDFAQLSRDQALALTDGQAQAYEAYLLRCSLFDKAQSLRAASSKRKLAPKTAGPRTATGITNPSSLPSPSQTSPAPAVKALDVTTSPHWSHANSLLVSTPLGTGALPNNLNIARFSPHSRALGAEFLSHQGLHANSLVAENRELMDSFLLVLSQSVPPKISPLDFASALHAKLFIEIAALRRAWSRINTPSSEFARADPTAIIALIASQLKALNHIAAMQERFIFALHAKDPTCGDILSPIYDMALASHAIAGAVPPVSLSCPPSFSPLDTAFQNDHNLRDRFHTACRLVLDNVKSAEATSKPSPAKKAKPSKSARPPKVSKPALTPRGQACSLWMSMPAQQDSIKAAKICMAFNSERGCYTTSCKYHHKCALCVAPAPVDHSLYGKCPGTKALGIAAS